MQGAKVKEQMYEVEQKKKELTLQIKEEMFKEKEELEKEIKEKENTPLKKTGKYYLPVQISLLTVFITIESPHSQFCRLHHQKVAKHNHQPPHEQLLPCSRY